MSCYAFQFQAWIQRFKASGSACRPSVDVREWRAIQTDRNRIELQLEFLADAELSFDETAFVRRLRAFGLPHEVHVDVEPVVGLRADKQTGKFRRMLSQVGAPHEAEAT